MRTQLRWHERPAHQRPRVSIGLPDLLNISRRQTWADIPTEAFLYHGARNPFGADGWGVDQIPYGWGGVVTDAFDPEFKRPWTDLTELERLGYVKLWKGF